VTCAPDLVPSTMVPKQTWWSTVTGVRLGRRLVARSWPPATGCGARARREPAKNDRSAPDQVPGCRGNRPEVTQCSVNSSTIDSGSTAAIKTVIAGAMTCAEDARLKLIYETALSAWLNSRQRLFEGVRSKETASEFRKQLLDARLKAATDLYEHSRTCPLCKTSIVKSIDRTEMFT
jgi:hypothetical protein